MLHYSHIGTRSTLIESPNARVYYIQHVTQNIEYLCWLHINKKRRKKKSKTFFSRLGHLRCIQLIYKTGTMKLKCPNFIERKVHRKAWSAWIAEPTNESNSTSRCNCYYTLRIFGWPPVIDLSVRKRDASENFGWDIGLLISATPSIPRYYFYI